MADSNGYQQLTQVQTNAKVQLAFNKNNRNNRNKRKRSSYMLPQTPLVKSIASSNSPNCKHHACPKGTYQFFTNRTAPASVHSLLCKPPKERYTRKLACMLPSHSSLCRSVCVSHSPKPLTTFPSQRRTSHILPRSR